MTDSDSSRRPSTAPLFAPISLRGVTLPNRFVMAPMTRGYSPGGVPGPDVAEYYARRAKADVGLILTEGVGIEHPGAIGSGSLREQDIPMMYGEGAMAGWKAVVDKVHAAGGAIMPQLWHMGVMRRVGTGPFPDAPSMRPSGVWGPQGPNTLLPAEYLKIVADDTPPMSDEDIADVIGAYESGARNAREAGFDGVAIHGAHGYMIDNFFWGPTNLRTDRWGGNLAERARFGAEVVIAIRRAIGPDLPIVFRYSQWKQHDYDAVLADTPAELEALLGPLVDAGVDMFDVSTRVFTRPAFKGSDLTLAGWTRKLTGVATMAVGGVGVSKDLLSGMASGGIVSVDNLADVMAHFERGEFDMVAVGRALLADPKWVSKVRNGEPFEPFSTEGLVKLY